MVDDVKTKPLRRALVIGKVGLREIGKFRTCRGGALIPAPDALWRFLVPRARGRRCLEDLAKDLRKILVQPPLTRNGTSLRYTALSYIASANH